MSRSLAGSFGLMLAAIWALAVLPGLAGAADRTIVLNVLMNGDFEGDAEAGIEPHGFWEGIRADAVRVEEGNHFARLGDSGVARVAQRVAVYAQLSRGVLARGRVRIRGPLAGKALVAVSVSDGAGRAVTYQFAGPPHKGGRTVEARLDTWTRFELPVGQDFFVQHTRAPTPPMSFQLHAADGAAEFDDLQFLVPVPRPTPEEVERRVLDVTKWAIDTVLRFGVDDVGKPSPFDIKWYDVRTGKPMGSHPGALADDYITDTVRHYALLTRDPAYTRRWLEMVDFTMEHSAMPNGVIVPWDGRRDEPDVRSRTGTHCTVEHLLDAFKLTGDLRYARAAKRLTDAAVKTCRRADGSFTFALFPDGRPYEDFSYYRAHVYGLFIPYVLSRLGAESGEAGYAELARDAVRAWRRYPWVGPWVREGHIDPYFDDYFGLATNYLIESHFVTGERFFLDAASEGARAMYGPWIHALQHYGTAAGDQPRCWDTYTYLGRITGEARYLRAVVLAALLLFNLRQGADGAWRGITTYRFRARSTSSGAYPPLNLLSGLVDAYEITRRPQDLARFALVFEEMLRVFGREHGIASKLSDRVTDWSSCNHSRLFRMPLKIVSVIRRQPRAPTQHRPCVPALNEAERARYDAAKREFREWAKLHRPPTPEPYPHPDRLQAIGFTESAVLGNVAQGRVAGDLFTYDDEFSKPARWKQQVYAVRTSFGAGHPSRYLAKLGAKPYLGHPVLGGLGGAHGVGVQPCGASGGFTLKFVFPRPARSVRIRSVHSAWSGDDRVALLTSLDGETWSQRFAQTAKSQAVTEDLDLSAEVAGRTQLFIRYDLRAGEPTRFFMDNRGAFVREFHLRTELSAE